ncbi:hypothetical protein [Hymenobacter arizonensis]|uniref:Uncharacterized protein n=1 Tax=Hymenobacter arizonensis TaxID=1227077 RepID=A0A1I6BG51_HYMAR|nr:hypothetical protein [Hymenobacter arizonensis]SFQ79912.1 hypothetical protein SAMN04515668_4515 [Hymenobacter arizonensis]
MMYASALLLQAATPATAIPVVNSFFTTESFATFGGATAITFVVANGIQRAFDYNPKWLALAIAIAVCEMVVVVSGPITAAACTVALLNGFLVYSTAGGITSLPGNPNPGHTSGGGAARSPLNVPGATAAAARPNRKFLSSWF